MSRHAQHLTVRRIVGWGLAGSVSLMLAACGGDDGDSTAPNPLPGPTVTTLSPDQPEVLNLPTVDGYLVSASATEVVLNTAAGKLTLTVDAADAPLLGIEHLQSHAGLDSLGFRVFYEQRGSQRVIKRAFEIPPPPFEPAE